jgi:hypothetical protein
MPGMITIRSLLPEALTAAWTVEPALLASAG